MYNRGERIRIRVFSVACYLGFAPQIYSLATKSNWEDRTLQHHIRYGLALYYLLLFLMIAYMVGVCLEYLIGILLSAYFPDTLWDLYTFLDHYKLIELNIIIPCSLIVFWAGLWFFSIIGAALGSTLRIPLLSRLSENQKSRKISLQGGKFLQFLFIAVVFIVARGNYLANQYHNSASVYLLYNENIGVPRWVYASGLYPVSEIATSRWGKGSVVIEPLTRESIDEAIQNGRLVILATHGTSTGEIPLSNDSSDFYFPSDIQKRGGAGSNLQFIYISGCYTGVIRDKWNQAFMPAEVVTFDRFSWIIEHVFWLWFDGPIVVSRMN